MSVTFKILDSEQKKQNFVVSVVMLQIVLFVLDIVQFVY